MKLYYLTLSLSAFVVTATLTHAKDTDHNARITPAEGTEALVASSNRATTYSSLLTLNVSNAIVVALFAAAGAFYYTGIPFVSIRRSVTSFWDSFGIADFMDSGLSRVWDSGLSDALATLLPVVQEALRVYSENYA
ncbi:uncharacterized protein LOC123507946 [Portunus trituberculatus]|uniref:uncharacterized protein LOC123507946 n=1 Tax=Portunus trituberculatus TaxID=210409 RepID=UPI001E1CB04A|nr:uncharacterized protein LOC123507946 [Portunus trituberculatus]